MNEILLIGRIGQLKMQIISHWPI